MASKNTGPVALNARSIHQATLRLKRNDPLLHSLHAAHGTPPLWKRPATFQSLVRIIIEQQVSLAAGATIFKRLKKACNGNITATRIRSLTEKDIRACGLSGAKTRYTIALADDVRHRRLQVASLARKSDEEVRADITARHGLGNWSADVFLLLSLCRRDVLPVADLAFVKGLEELDQTTYASPENILQRTACWRPYRSIGVRMIWQSYVQRRNRDVPT